MNEHKDPTDSVDATHKFSEDLIPVDANSLSDEDQLAVDSLPTGNALLIVRRGPNKGSRFLLDSDLVSIGSYCVVFDTVIEDLPDELHSDRPWGKGNNPKSAVFKFLAKNSNFVIDAGIDEKIQISVAPSGYLKRVN